MRKIKLPGLVISLLFLLTVSLSSFSQIVLNTPNTDSRLYLGKGNSQPLIVGLGGSEGGNAWASDYWKKTRDKFIGKGYSFLAIGYFGVKGSPDTLQQISINDVHNAIIEATKHSAVDKNKIAIVGGSRGADLALLLGSYYNDIKCVVGIVPGNVAFPGNTNHFTTSAWTYQDKELPFVPVNEEAVPFLIKRDLRGAFEAMLKDSVAVDHALIKVENIKGPVLLISATKDEICPSTPMCEKMMVRLQNKNFKYYSEHIAIEGGHAEPLNHLDVVFTFLQKYFPCK